MRSKTLIWLLQMGILVLLLLPLAACLTKIVYLKGDQKIVKVSELKDANGAYQIPRDIEDWYIISPANFSELYQCCYEKVESKK